MSVPASIPMLQGEGNLALYLRAIQKFPVLDAHEEYMLAKAWKNHGDRDAAHKLVTSHLRLVAKIARGYRGYGLPLSDLIAEGNIGMMQAVKGFDPERGFRLATYAIWWIKAAMQEYILHSWSLVKIGTTAAQKKLFFNLRRLKGEMRALEDGDLSPEMVHKIAHRLAVSEDEVVNMNRRLLGGGDQSLNTAIRGDGDGDDEWQDWLIDPQDNQEITLGAREEGLARHRILQGALRSLKPREREIIMARRLAEHPVTLEDLSQKLGISRERVRQIEVSAFAKLQTQVKKNALLESKKNLLPPAKK